MLIADPLPVAQSENAALLLFIGQTTCDITPATPLQDSVVYLVGAGLVTGTILPMDGGFTVA
jgi:hypothetical protein